MNAGMPIVRSPAYGMVQFCFLNGSFRQHPQNGGLNPYSQIVRGFPLPLWLTGVVEQAHQEGRAFGMFIWILSQLGK